MSRTHRDILRVKARMFWDSIYENSFRRWGQMTRDELREADKVDYHGHRNFGKEDRRIIHRRERARIHMSLKHGGLYWYYRRKHGDGYWD